MHSPSLTHPERAFLDTIRATLGHAPDALPLGKLHRFSTNGRRSDLSGWCVLFEGAQAGVYGDWRGHADHVWTAKPSARMSRAEKAKLATQRQQAQAARAQMQAQEWHTAQRSNQTIWHQAHSIDATGGGRDPVTTYLRNRLALADWEPLKVPAALRFHPRLPYYHEGELVGHWPAMVATMTNPQGQQVALHRTWITPDGRKADLPGPGKKLSRTSGPLMGSCIRLGWLDDALALGASTPMGVAEGIETALAAQQGAGVPTVAAYSANALAAWCWPQGLKGLLIFADHDAPNAQGHQPGAAAATKLRHRAQRAGLKVNVLQPSAAGFDWCDLLALREKT